MSDIPKIVRFLRSILDRSIETPMKDLPTFTDEYTRDNFIIRLLHGKLQECTEDVIQLTKLINDMNTREEIDEATIFLTDNTPNNLILYRNNCRRFNCIPDQLYYLLFMVSFMRNKPLNDMPSPFIFIDVKTVNWHDDHLKCFAFILDNIIRPVRRQIRQIHQIAKFAEMIPTYDRRSVVEMFFLMQFNTELFRKSMRYLNMNILLETNTLYNTTWQDNIKITDNTFLQLTKLITTLQH